MVQPGRRLRLPLEPAAMLRRGLRRPVQELQRHAAAQRDLLGLVDHPHPAPADLADDPVVADLARLRRGHRPAVVLGLRRRPELVDQRHRGEHAADRLGQRGIPRRVLLDGGTLAPPPPRQELLGQRLDRVAAG